MFSRLPRGPESSAQIDFYARQFGGEPLGHGSPAAVDVARHQEVADDEFTVLLCRGHHRRVHQTGNEEAWWEDLQINALEVSRGLWEQSMLTKSRGETF